MNLLKKKSPLNLDPEKPTILFFDKGKEYTHVYGAARVIRQHLAKTCNIIVVGMGCNIANNYYEINRSFGDDLVRKVQTDEDYIYLNKTAMLKQIKEDLKDITTVDYVVIGVDDWFQLPLTNYCSASFDQHLHDLKNEYFDTISDTSTEKINRIEDVTDSVIENFDYKVSPIAFSTKDKSYAMFVLKYLFDSGILKKDVLCFAIDPTFYTPFFTRNGIPAKFLYFEDDRRGTRDFQKFDIAQFQHIVYDKPFTRMSVFSEQTELFFFVGTILQEKGDRADLWDKYLNDLEIPRSVIHVPLKKNSIGKRDTERTNALAKERFPDLYDKIKNHPLWRGRIDPQDMVNEIKSYKYGFVPHCTSYYDSLNFRPCHYAYINIIPLLEESYDPEYLMIPKHLQDQLVVHSAKDIEERVKFFEDNPDDRNAVLTELRELFKIQDYISDPIGMVDKEIKRIMNV